ncbi:hypothetical protein Tco_0636916 [Tanacetum coccineum]
MEYNKRIQRHWLVIPSGYREVEIKINSDWELMNGILNGGPRIKRIRHPTEDEDHVVTSVGRVMHCHKCWETRHNKTSFTNQERPKPAYLKSKGIVFHDAPSSSMPPPTATPSISNTMPPPPTLSSSNTIPPSLTQSTSNTMPPPPTPSGSNTTPPPFTPSVSNTMPLNATPGSHTMPLYSTSASIGTNKGKGHLIPKKEADLPKVVFLAA